MEIHKSTFDRITHAIQQTNIPVFILIIGALVRLIGYSSSAIRYDEAISLYRATIPFNQYLVDLQRYSSLFLWELILRVISVVGTSLWIIRLPAVMIGILSLIIVWKLMRFLNFSTTQQSVIAVVISFCPGLIWISQDARAYGLLVFLFLLSILFILERKWLGFFAVNGLLIYTHIIGPAFAAGSFAFAFALHPKDWKRLIGIGLAVTVSWIPWVILYLNLKETPLFINTFWLGHLTFDNFFRQLILAFFVRRVNYFALILFSATMLFSVILLVINSIRRPKRVLLLFSVPFLVIFLESIFWENTLFYRTQISLIIPFMISLGSIFIPGKRSFYIWIIMVLWVVLAGVGIIGWNPRLRGGDVDKTASLIRNNWQEGDVLYYATGTTAMPFDYYLNDKPEFILNGIANSNLTPPTLDLKFEFIQLEKIVYKRAWVIFPLDTFIPPDQMKRMDEYVREGVLINRIQIFEVPDILVYVVGSEK
jgi:hypothetical protein